MTTMTADKLRQAKTDDTSPSRLKTANEGFFELVLSEGRQMDDLVMDDSRLSSTVQKLLLVSMAGLMIYGALVGIAASA